MPAPVAIRAIARGRRAGVWLGAAYPGGPMHVLLHIGSPKAGSTTIQTALRLNRAALRAEGVLAWEPDASRGPPARTLANVFTREGKPLLPRERLHFTTRAEARDWAETAWQSLADEVARTRPALTVLSSEQLYEVRNIKPVLARLAAIFDGVTVLAYVRDPVSQFRSMLDQRIRDGDRFADLPLPSVPVQQGHVTLANWIDRLGAQRVILRALDRQSLVGGDLVADLAAQIGAVLGRAVQLPEPVGMVNESLSAAATLWLMAANEAFIRFGEGDRDLVQRRFGLLRRLESAPALAGLPKLADPPAPLCDWIRHANREAAGFFAGAGLVMPAAPEGLTLPPPEAQRAALRDWLLAHRDGAALTRVIDAAIGE